MVHTLPRDSTLRDAACEILVARFQSLVRSCAQRYRDSPESQDELMQVGWRTGACGMCHSVLHADDRRQIS